MVWPKTWKEKIMLSLSSLEIGKGRSVLELLWMEGEISIFGN